MILKKNTVEIHKKYSEDWKVTLVDTGINTLTGGRLLRIKEYIKDTFCMTYGDGLSNVDINKLIEFHKSHGKLATLTAVQPEARWGALKIQGENIKSFEEKPSGDGAWINGGFFVLEPSIFKFIDGDQCVWENKVLRKMASEDQLMSFKHYDFWKPMDTLRDKLYLDSLAKSKTPPWFKKGL